MRVLLIQPPLEDFYTTPIRLYPLGLLYAAAVLQKTGCQVRILDCLTPLKKKQRPLPGDFSYLKPLQQSNPLLFKHYYRFGISTEKILSALDAFGPEMVGIASQFTAYYQSVAQLSVDIKRHGRIPIFVGGNHASVFKDEILKKTPQIDFVLPGPAEHSLPPFLAAHTRLACPAEPLDWKTLQPAHELLTSGAYKIGARNYMSLTASRGCPYRCQFCSVQAMFGHRIAYRRVSDVLAEMSWNYRHKAVRVFNFEDDNISFDRDWFCRLLTAVIEQPELKDIELTAMNGICYPTLSEEVLVLMRRAGFRRLNLSFVTRDEGLQRQYRRPPHSPDFEKIIAVARRLELSVTVYVIIGLPQQTFEEIKQSVDYLLDLGVLVGPSVFYLPPGSGLFEQLDIPSDISTNWNLYRSSAFALETPYLSRADLVSLFTYVRRRNLANKTRN